MANNQQETIVVGSSKVEKPKNIIDATSQIQQYYTFEKEGTPISSDFLTVEGSLELFSVGLKTAVKNGLFSAISSPLMIGAFKKYFYVFGNEANLYDKIWITLVNYSLTICYAILLSYIARYYIGNITKSSIKHLFSGIIIGTTVFTIFIFILYHTLYYLVLTPEKLAAFCLSFKGWISDEIIQKMYLLLLYISRTLVPSSWAIVINMTIMLSIPVFFLVFKARKIDKELHHRDKWQIGV